MTAKDFQMVLQTARPKSPPLVGLAKRHIDNLRRRDFITGAALIDGRWIEGDQEMLSSIRQLAK
ncbi:hypothetical protein IVB20_24225 [Bradyrhizobium sp. 188]|nr:hypothetical protein [Bradyrhizobium sp. 188]